MHGGEIGFCMILPGGRLYGIYPFSVAQQRNWTPRWLLTR